MGLDDRLLNSSSDRAGALNEAKRESGDDQNQNTEAPLSLREAVQAEKRRQVISDAEKEGKMSGAINQAAAPMRKGTSRLLRQAWLHLIDSWGFTLIWINIHVFLGTIFGERFFCKLGAEWMDNNIQSANMEAAKKLGDKGRIAEGVGLACCNLGCLFIIISALAIAGAVIGVIDNPLRALIALLKGVFTDWTQWE